jgi:putative nucleotidyltransferase with HDIG domain
MTVQESDRREGRAASVAAVWEAFPELEEIRDRALADTVAQIWVEVWEESDWERLEDAPKNPYTVRLDHSTVTHTRSVLAQSLAIADALERFHGLHTDRDTIIAAVLLHDVSKLLEFEPSDSGGRNSRFGDLIQHAVYGMHKAWAHGLSTDLAHIVGSHTTASRLAPKTLEAVIVHYADFADTDALVWENGGKLHLTAAR